MGLQAVRLETIKKPAEEYESPEKLKKLLPRGKFMLDCGHKVTLGHNFGNDIAILNGKKLRIICTLCFD